MNLLFDLDGTLTDPAAGIVACMRHALAGLGYNADDFDNLERYIGPPLLDSFRDLLGDNAEASRALTVYRERFARLGLYENEVYPGIVECLDELRAAGHALVVATSKPAVFARRIIEHFEIQGFFRQIYGSELDGRLADKSELIEAVLRAEGFLAAQSLMIGDRSFDGIGARANGLRFLGVTWGYGSSDELVAAGAHALCGTPPQLAGLIRSMD